MVDTGYATIAELKLAIQITKPTNDAILQSILNYAAAALDNRCRPNHGKPSGERDFFIADTTATAAAYSGTGGATQRIDECTDITLVAVKDSADDAAYVSWAATDWIKASGDVRRPEFNKTPYDLLLIGPDGDYSRFLSGTYSGLRGFAPEIARGYGVQTVQVTAKWGYATTVPDDIKAATIMQAARWYKRLQGSMSDVLASGTLGTLIFTKRLDPDIAGILEDGRYVEPVI